MLQRSRIPRCSRPNFPVEEMARLRAELDVEPRLLVKRDDSIPFGFGGNKVHQGFEYARLRRFAFPTPTPS